MTIKKMLILVSFSLVWNAFSAIVAQSSSESFEQAVQSYIENYPFLIMTETCKKMTNPLLFGEIPGAAPFWQLLSRQALAGL